MLDAEGRYSLSIQFEYPTYQILSLFISWCVKSRPAIWQAVRLAALQIFPTDHPPPYSCLVPTQHILCSDSLEQIRFKENRGNKQKLATAVFISYMQCNGVSYVPNITIILVVLLQISTTQHGVRPTTCSTQADLNRLFCLPTHAPIIKWLR